MTKLLLSLILVLIALRPEIAVGKDAPPFALSPYFHVPDGLPQDDDPLSFRYEWSLKKPYTLSIQFTNAGYKTLALKFAVRDLTRHETLLLDPVRNSYFVQETLGMNSDGKSWAAEVADPHDLFSLRLWNDQGMFFDQPPFSLKPEWAVASRSPSFSSTPILSNYTPSIDMKQVVQLKEEIQRLGRKPKVKNLEPAVYAALGDSYTQGFGTSSTASSFYSLSLEGLRISNPHLYPDRKIVTGCSPASWINSIPKTFQETQKRWKVPVRYVLFETGISCFFTVHHGDDSCRGASVAEGISTSYVYQRNMRRNIEALYKAAPGAIIVVTDIPDTSGGTGHYAPREVYEAYRQRLWELKKDFPRLRVADIYQATNGHSEYFHHENNDKDHPNDIGQAVMAKCILEQFLK